MRQQVKVYLHAAFGEHLAALLQDRKCLQSQKVEFNQASTFHIFHVELRDGHVRTWVAVQGRQFRQFPVTNDHACCVRRTVPWQTFKLHRKIEQTLHLSVTPIFFAQLRNSR